MRLPYDGDIRITNPFGSKPNGIKYSAGYHTGIDFVGVDDKQIKAVCAGVVFHVGFDDDGWGKYVVIKQEDGLLAHYCHMSRANVVTGKKIAEGDVLGLEGSTGNSTGSHCHFELRTEAWNYKTVVDPAKYLGILNKVGYVEEIEMLKEIEIELNGEVRKVDAIEKDGFNYVKLQSMRDENIVVDYDATNKRPKITTI